MTERSISLSRTATVALAGAILLFVQGCKTTPKVDWNARVGSYTYDRAVTELGPPDKVAKLSDGTTVAEWVTGHRSGSSFSFGTGMYSGHGGVAVGQTVGGGGGLRFLRLVFGPDNRLVSWSKGG
jgi:hypothetical protein